MSLYAECKMPTSDTESSTRRTPTIASVEMIDMDCSSAGDAPKDHRNKNT